MTSFGDRLRARMQAPLDCALSSEMSTALDELFTYTGFIEFIEERCAAAIDEDKARYEHFMLHKALDKYGTTLSCQSTYKQCTITRASTSALRQQWSSDRCLQKAFLQRLKQHFDGVDIESVDSSSFPDSIAFVITWAREPETATVLSRLDRLEERTARLPPISWGVRLDYARGSQYWPQ